MEFMEYNTWWIEHTDADGQLLPDLPEPVATLAAHVMALQERVDLLPGPHDDDDDDDDLIVDNVWVTQCACAYDHPAARCLAHTGERWPS